MEDLNFIYKLDDKSFNVDTIDIDSYHCVKCISVYMNNTLTFDYKVTYDETDWVKVIKQTSHIYLYVKDNFTINDRFFYLTIENYYTGSKDIITFKQEKCNFDIKTKDGLITKELGFNEIEILLLVSGASKSCFINNDSIYIEYESNLLAYDNSLFYTLTKNINKVNEKEDEYKLKIKLLGDFEGRKVYKYIMPITHSDNSEVNLMLTLKVNRSYSLDESNISNSFDYEWDLQKEKNSIREINMDNLESEFDETTTEQHQSDANEISIASEEIIEYVDSLSIEEIQYFDNNTKVLLKAKTAPEFDSLIFINPKAQWIKSKTELSLETKLHEITIYCDKNYWGIQRKALITLTNAENPNITLTYLIIQEANNTISIEEYIKD